MSKMQGLKVHLHPKKITLSHSESFQFSQQLFFNNLNNYFCSNYQIREKIFKNFQHLSQQLLSIQSKPKILFISIPLSLIQILFNFTASHTNSFPFFFFFSIILIPLLPSSTTMMPISLCQGQAVEDLMATHGSRSDVGQNIW